MSIGNNHSELQAATLTVESWPIDRVKPYAGNPRTIPDEAVKAVAQSIKQFGWRQPIVVDRDSTIICGHTRLLAAKKLGLSHVPVHVADLDEAAVRALRLADNKSAELSGWDMKILPVEISALLDMDWDLTSLGFDEEELAKLLDGSAGFAGETDADAVPEVDESEPPVSKVGEIYALGRHRLLCGDATDAAAVTKLLAGQTIDLMFTDPPYGVSYCDKNEMLNALDRGNRVQTPIANDHLSLEDTALLWLASFKAWAPHFADYSSYYVFTATSNDLLPTMLDAMAVAGMRYRHMLVWSKNCHVLGRSDFHYRHEILLYGWARRHRFFGLGPQKTTVWDYPRPTSNDIHPTVKPTALIENALLNSTQKDMLVVDPFLGSGSTLIACERTGRICIGTELEPHYCDVIRRRWAQHCSGEDCDWVAATPSI